jgi:nucleotide-binding universal stress UspA family protein
MYQRILVPINNNLTANDVLTEAIKLAAGKAQVRLVYVVEDGYPLDDEACELIDFRAMVQAANETGERVLFYAAKKVRESGAEVNTALFVEPCERPASVIDRESRNWKADLIVIGAHGSSGFSSLLLGSVADEIVRIASVPVLLVRSN